MPAQIGLVLSAGRISETHMPRTSFLGLFKQRGRGRDDSDPGPTPRPTYAATVSPTTVSEGSSVTITLTTTSVANNTVIYWTLYNSTAGSSDFSTASSGTVIVQNNLATLTLTLAADGLTEGSEFFYIAFRQDSIAGRILTVSPGITVNDTSQTVTYAVAPAATSVNEGSAVTFNVTTTGLMGSNTLYWSVYAPLVWRRPADAADFVAVNGTVTVTNNSGSFTVTPRADQITEGGSDPDMFHVQLRTGSVTGAIVATSSGVQIIDTSRTPPPPPPTATLTLIDSTGVQYNVLSSPMSAGIQDTRNVFNLGSNLYTLRPIVAMDLAVFNAAQITPLNTNVDVSTLKWWFYRQPVGGSVAFVPTLRNYTTTTGFGRSWRSVTHTAQVRVFCFSFVNNTARYRIYEGVTTRPTVWSLNFNPTPATNLALLAAQKPVWLHHPRTAAENFVASDYVGWRTILIPQLNLKFIWRIKASNQA